MTDPAVPAASTIDYARRRVQSPRRRLRLWPAFVVLALFWIFFYVITLPDLPMVTVYVSQLLAILAMTVLLTVWWLTRKTVRWRDRWVLLLAVIVVGTMAGLASDHSVVVPGMLFYSGLGLCTLGVLWLAVTQGVRWPVRRLGLVVLIILAFIWYPAVRMEGMSGSGMMNLHPRWTKSTEQLKLESARAANTVLHTRPAGPALVATEEDWPAFRGANRDDAARGTLARTDWDNTPPKNLWRRDMPLGWSSITAVGDCLFTQGQLGEEEQVLCIDAATGQTVWVHSDPTRFFESMGGVGPRSTPAFADGRIVSVGATGIVNCLDAATGEKRWSIDLTSVAAAPKPMWGFASSPLVVDQKVYIFAGGTAGKSLLALNLRDGSVAWTADPGSDGYSSPQLVELDGVKQILMVTTKQLSAFDPESGKSLWSFNFPGKQSQPAVQPRVVDGSSVLFSFGPDPGMQLLNVSHSGGGWEIKQRWQSRDLKPFYNDAVLYQGHLYGFDGSIFTCVDLETGKRLWKKGRYGYGQTILLPDQGLLLVLSETGEAVLVRADPTSHQEVGKFQAVTGKCWSRPTLVRGRLYVRSDSEMAAFDVAH